MLRLIVKLYRPWVIIPLLLAHTGITILAASFIQQQTNDGALRSGDLAFFQLQEIGEEIFAIRSLSGRSQDLLLDYQNPLVRPQVIDEVIRSIEEINGRTSKMEFLLRESTDAVRSSPRQSDDFSLLIYAYFALTYFLVFLFWLFGARKRKVIHRFKDAEFYQSAKNIGSTVKNIRRRARAQRRLSVFTLLLGFVFLGIGFYVFFDPQTVGASPERALREVHSTVRSMKDDVVPIRELMARFDTTYLTAVQRFDARLNSFMNEVRLSTEDPNSPVPRDTDLLREISQILGLIRETGDNLRQMTPSVRVIGRNLETVPSTIDTILSRSVSNDFDAAFVETMVKRLGALVFLFFTITILMSRYQYLTELAAHYESLGDSIELSFSQSSKKEVQEAYIRLFDLAQRPTIVSDNPANPNDEILSGIRELLRNVSRKGEWPRITHPSSTH